MTLHEELRAYLLERCRVEGLRDVEIIIRSVEGEFADGRITGVQEGGMATLWVDQDDIRRDPRSGFPPLDHFEREDALALIRVAEKAWPGIVREATA